MKQQHCSQFSSPDIVAAFNIFNPKVIPYADCEKFKTYSEMSVDTLIRALWNCKDSRDSKRRWVHEVTIIFPHFSETHTEWKTIQDYFSKKWEDDTKTVRRAL